MIEKMVHEIKQAYIDLNTTKAKPSRDFIKAYKKKFKEWKMEDVISLCHQLLKERYWPTSRMAYQIIYDQRTRITKKMFSTFNHWVLKYVRDWKDCDDFLTHAFAYYFVKYPEMLSHIKDWVHDEHFGVRRAAAVALIVPAKKKLITFDQIKEVCDLLSFDDNYLVVKGYGWLLKVASINYHDDVIKYLRKRVKTMPRTAFRYAIEKLPDQERELLMSL